MRLSSLTYNLLLAFVIFLGGQLVGAGRTVTPAQPPDPEGPQLHLRARVINPQGEPAPSSLSDESPDRAALHLVQFTGPIQDAWLTVLQSCGLQRAGYVPDYAYLVWGTGAGIDCVEQAVPLRWHGPFRPAYALHPSLAQLTASEDKPTEPVWVNVIIQLLETPETDASATAILLAAQDVVRRTQSYLGYRVLGVRLMADRLEQIAALPGVVNIEPLPRYTRKDEVQGQIIAGNLAAGSARPSGPGYLAWLTAQGFSTNPEDYPIVDVTDDGIDDGSATPLHADFYKLGNKANPDRLIYNLDWTSDPSAAGVDGHGNINASIVAGYNNLPGAAYTDSQGYHYGLGINPFGRVAGSKIFSSIVGWDLPNDDFRALLKTTYLNGGRISTNSWGSYTYGTYTSDDQVYDALVRDSVDDQPGNQEMIIIFSAGNSGPSEGTIGSPGNAKNVVTVGAAENYRPTWTDGCGLGPAGADDAQDIAGFSSRGPTNDGRVKPDLVAPGTHIQGAASQAPGYTGYQVCDSYQPSGQTLYAASSGTSHSAPAVAGAASLFYAFYRQHYGDSPPSPAMVKAYLANSARYLTGAGANDILPSNSQGLGEVFLGRAFNNVSRTLVDQQIELTESGQLYSLRTRIANPSQPLRVTLAWSDAPGAPYAAAYVNNLDLEVQIDGQTYLGNVFNGTFSIPGGEADTVNNLENVFLPAGRSGTVFVRVRATNIAGDGVPGDDDLTDQDFALVIYNGAQVLGTLKGTVVDQSSGDPLFGTLLQASNTNWNYLTSTETTGVYTLPLLADTYTVSAWKYGYSLGVATGVVITDERTTIQDFELSPVTGYRLQGCITDLVTGQGLAAAVSVSGPFGAPITETLTTRSDPCYNLHLFAAVYTLHVESVLHFPEDAQVALDADTTLDFSLEASTLDGLLYGRITDYNTNQPLSGIDLYIASMLNPSPGAYQAASGNDGLYEILLSPDTYTISIDAPLFTPVLQGGVAVPQSNIEERDFALRSPRMALTSSQPLRFDLQPGEQDSVTLQMSNNGSAVLDYKIYEASGGSFGRGPDPAGYLVLNSLDSDVAQFEWIDVSDGVRLVLWDDDEINVNLPFSFIYYGLTSDHLRIGNNGAVLFGVVDGEIRYNNQRLLDAPDYLIAPFWDDLDSDYGWVSYKTFGVSPHRRFVVEWFSRPHYAYEGGAVTFELILYEGSNDLKFQYQDVFFDNTYVDQGNTATVGIRGRGHSYLEYSYDSPLLDDSLALCFQAPGALPCDLEEVPWLTITPDAGVLIEQGATTVTIQVNADEAGLGDHHANVRLRSNDPMHQPYIDIPVRLVVHDNDRFFPFLPFLLQSLSP